MTENNKLTVSDIEEKVQARLEYLERNGATLRLDEMMQFQEWLLNGETYHT